MSIEELKSLYILGKTVYVIGFPASGKSFIANELYHHAGRTHQLIHTDDFISEDFADSLYVMMDQLNDIPGHFIVEGVLVHRLLRKVYELKLDHLKPDLIVYISTPEWLQNEIYRTERPDKKLKGVKALNLSLTNIYNEWFFTTPDSEKPEIIEYLNDWK